MRDSRNPFDSQAYEDALEWLKLLLAVVTIAALITIYFLLPASGGQVVGFIKACIPNIVTALLVIPAAYVVLTRAGMHSDERLLRAIHESRGESNAILTFDNDIGGAAGLISEIVQQKSRQKSITIEILAFTGGTFTTTVLRDLINANPGKLRIVLRIIDFEVIKRSLLPTHWQQEAAETLVRLKAICENAHVELEIWQYPFFPFVLGLAIDKDHLLLAFPHWNINTGVLADASLTYRYYRKSESAEYLFSLFENWANQPGQQLTVSNLLTN